MMEWVRRNPVLAMLAGVAVLLVAVIAGEAVFSPQRASSAAPRKAVPAEAKLLPPLAAISADQAFPETAARPLFTPTRRAAPEAPAAEKNSFQKGQFVLQGVITHGPDKTAMLREKSTGKVVRVELGKEVNGIKVVSIEPEKVTLALGSDREELILTVQKPAGAPAVPTISNPTGPFVPVTPAPPPGLPTPTPVPGQPFVPPPPPAPPATAGQPAGGNPVARPEAQAAPLTPEELLARRRARRATPGQ